MPRVFASIGSNINKAQNLRSCFHTLQQLFRDVQKSSVYQSAAIGFDGADFYNMVVSLETTLTPEHIAKLFSEIEDQHGRERRENPFVSRTLDLDQLLYGDVIVNENGIRLPHRDLTRYAFIVKAMAEIAGDVKHPQLGKTFAELWRNFEPSQTQIKRIAFDWQCELPSRRKPPEPPSVPQSG